MTTKDLFTKAFLISFDEDRQKLIKKTFEAEVGFQPKLYRAFHEKKLLGSDNCSVSHAAIVKMAMALDWPYVTIFEDDAYPKIGASAIIDDYLKDIDPLKTDIGCLALGWQNCTMAFNNCRDKKIIPFDATKTFTGSQSYILFKKAYAIYHQYFESKSRPYADTIMKVMPNFNIVTKPIFIQYNFGESMGSKSCHPVYKGKHGYVLNGKVTDTPFEGFRKAEEYK